MNHPADFKYRFPYPNSSPFFPHLLRLPKSRSCKQRLITYSSSPTDSRPLDEAAFTLQEWVQQHQQEAFPADSSWSTSCLAEHVPALDESAESYFSSLLFPDNDITTTFDTCFLFNDPETMRNIHDQSTDDQSSGRSLPSWPAVNDSLLASRSSPLELPVLSVPAATEPSYLLDPMPMTIGSRQSSPKKRPSNEASDCISTSPSSTYRSENDRVTKRQRNTEAARRYRQRKVDQVSVLEEALASITKERDELKLKLARSEAEADVLRGLVGKRP